MKSTIKIKNENYSYVITITERIDTAIDMLNLTNLLHIEQETMSKFDTFRQDLFTYLDKYEVILNIENEYFKGINDVIWEFKMTLCPKVGNTPEINTELILGEVIKSIYHYFYINTNNKWRTPELIGDKYDNEAYKDLMILKG